MRFARTFGTVDYHELKFHFLRDYAFYENGDAVADRKFVAVFRKSGKVGRKLHEYTVLLNAAHNSGHGLPDRVFCGVFLPCSEELTV